jgi:hypothetical protein
MDISSKLINFRLCCAPSINHQFNLILDFEERGQMRDREAGVVGV